MENSKQNFDNDKLDKLIDEFVETSLITLRENARKRFEVEESNVFEEFDAHQNTITNRYGYIGWGVSELCEILRVLDSLDGSTEKGLKILHNFEDVLTPFEYEILSPLLQKLHHAIVMEAFLENQNKKIKNTLCIYIVQFENLTVKIGISGDFNVRLKQLINSSGMDALNWCRTDYIEKSKAAQIEKNCHDFFKDKRLNGEFFQISFAEACSLLQKYAAITATN